VKNPFCAMDDFKRLARVAPSSSIMPFYEAKEIAADFGNSVVEFGKFVNESFDQEPQPLSLPVNHLKHSKWQIQIALAVVIAEYVIYSTLKPSDHTRKILDAARGISGELANFTREPAFVPIKKGDPHYWGFLSAGEAIWIYLEWQKKCEHCLIEIAGQPPELNKAFRWPSEQASIKYWQAIDGFLSELLNNPTLIDIREI
jgi:hypothetical protein